MTWAAWRILRTFFLVVVALTIVLIIVLIVDGVDIRSLSHSLITGRCLSGTYGSTPHLVYCRNVDTRLMRLEGFDRYLAGLSIAPVILAIILGTNLIASEVEHKTVRLAWTQSLTRSKWMSTKFTLELAMLLIIAIPLSFTYSWWFEAVAYGSRVRPTHLFFDGWLMVAIAIFALVATSLLGGVVRRPAWTFASALVIVLIFSWYVQTDINPKIVPLHTVNIGVKVTVRKGVMHVINFGQQPSNSWSVFSGYEPLAPGGGIPNKGQEISLEDDVTNCQNLPSLNANPNNQMICLSKLNLRYVAIYVADSEYWDLQLRDGILYLSVAGALLAVNFWFIRRLRV